MKIACPNCAASGSIPDHEIPEEGRFLSCPRCNHGFAVRKPQPKNNAYLADTCPSCNYSTFGDERFSTCPKCGVMVKAFVERQREDAQRRRDQELLARKYSHDVAPPPPEQESAVIADFVETLHPVNLIAWGVSLAALVIVGVGLWGLVEYHGGDIQAQLSAQRDEPVSAWYVFLHYGALPWIKTLYGAALLASGLLFMKRSARSLRVLAQLLWAAIFFVPLYFIGGFVVWVMEPIPHSLSGYFIEIVNIVLMTALWCIPLFLLARFLSDRRITSVVKL